MLGLQRQAIQMNKMSLFSVSAEAIARNIAVDISPELLAKAKLKNLPIEQVTFLEKRFEDGEFDGPFEGISRSSIRII